MKFGVVAPGCAAAEWERNLVAIFIVLQSISGGRALLTWFHFKLWLPVVALLSLKLFYVQSHGLIILTNLPLTSGHFRENLQQTDSLFCLSEAHSWSIMVVCYRSGSRDYHLKTLNTLTPTRKSDFLLLQFLNMSTVLETVPFLSSKDIDCCI